MASINTNKILLMFIRNISFNFDFQKIKDFKNKIIYNMFLFVTYAKTLSCNGDHLRSIKDRNAFDDKKTEICKANERRGRRTIIDDNTSHGPGVM